MNTDKHFWEFPYHPVDGYKPIYAPVEHPHGTVHKTQAEAMEAEHAHEAAK